MDDAGLGCVVSGLQLWDVDNVTAHASSGDERAIGVVLQLLAVQSGSLLLLPSPVRGGGLGAVEGTVQVGHDDVLVVVDLAIDHGTLGPWNTRVGDEDIETAVELLDDVVDGLFNWSVFLDVHLVCLACEIRLVRDLACLLPRDAPQINDWNRWMGGRNRRASSYT